MRRVTPFQFALALCFTLTSCKNTTPVKLRYREGAVQHGGVITGTVIFNGPKPEAVPVIATRDQQICGLSHPNPSDPGAGSGIAGALVYLENIEAGKPFPKTGLTPELGMKGCEYTPHLQVVMNGSKLRVLNEDAAEHDTHFFLNGKPIDLTTQPAGSAASEVALLAPGLYNFYCDQHTWMRGYVAVMAHPYYTVTDTEGRFTLADVPPGTYVLKVWRDSWVLGQPKGPDGKVTTYDWGGDMRDQQTVVVKPDANTITQFRLHS